MSSPNWEQIWEDRIESKIDVEKLHKEYNGDIHNYLEKELPKNKYIPNAKEELIAHLEAHKVDAYDEIKDIASKDIEEVSTKSWSVGVPEDYAKLRVEDDNDEYDKITEIPMKQGDVEGLLKIPPKTKYQEERKQVFLYNTLNPEITKASRDKGKLEELRSLAGNLTLVSDKS